jgi:hypothetical protein
LSIYIRNANLTVYGKLTTIYYCDLMEHDITDLESLDSFHPFILDPSKIHPDCKLEE